MHNHKKVLIDLMGLGVLPNVCVKSVIRIHQGKSQSVLAKTRRGHHKKPRMSASNPFSSPLREAPRILKVSENSLK